MLHHLTGSLSRPRLPQEQFAPREPASKQLSRMINHSSTLNATLFAPPNQGVRDLCRSPCDDTHSSGPARSRFVLRVRPPGRRVDRPQGRRVCRELKWALLSAAQPKSAHRGHRTRHARPPAPRSLPRRPPVIFLTMAVPRRDFFAKSQLRQLKSTNTNTTTLMCSLKVTWL